MENVEKDEMTKQTFFVIASALIIAGFALLVVGLQGQPTLWYVGLGAVAVAMLLSPATRWTPGPKEGQESKDG